MQDLYTKPILLGAFINRLKQQDSSSFISYDFGALTPTTFKSWRGLYSHLALGYLSERGQSKTVFELLRESELALNNSFYGYKGGEYIMFSDTPIWADNWGESSCCAVVDVCKGEFDVKIITKYFEYDVLTSL